MEKIERQERRDDHERAKKKLKSEVSSEVATLQPVPMNIDELVECCQKHNIPFERPTVRLSDNHYRILFLRGKRKPRRYSLVIFQPNDGSDPRRPRKGIAEWSSLLKYRHTARLSDEQGILATLGCKKTELGPLSVCNKNCTTAICSGQKYPPLAHETSVTVGLERSLVDADEMCWMKVGDNVNDVGLPCLRLGLRVSAYIQLLKVCGVVPIFL